METPCHRYYNSKYQDWVVLRHPHSWSWYVFWSVLPKQGFRCDNTINFKFQNNPLLWTVKITEITYIRFAGPVGSGPER